MVTLALVTGCNRTLQQPVEPPLVYVDSSSQEQLHILTSPTYLLQAGLPKAPIPDEATRGKFFIGSWVSPFIPRSTFEYARFLYTAEQTCQIWPQGNGLALRYELYNEIGEVVKEDGIDVDVQTCSTG